MPPEPPQQEVDNEMATINVSAKTLGILATAFLSIALFLAGLWASRIDANSVKASEGVARLEVLVTTEMTLVKARLQGLPRLERILNIESDITALQLSVNSQKDVLDADLDRNQRIFNRLRALESRHGPPVESK